MTPDDLCCSIAARQLGPISRAQALGTGISARGISRRLASGRWLVVLPGVYVIAGAPDSWERRAVAVQLWAGPKAALSHLTAAAILGLRAGRPLRIDVTTTRRLQATGSSVHRSPLLANEAIRVGPFVVTSPLRTLVDLASVMDEGRLEDCVEEALFQRSVDVSSLHARLDDGLRGSKGAPALRHLLEIRDPSWKPTENNFESLLFRTLRTARLPLPDRQVRIWDGPSIVTRLDFAYRLAVLAVPADSYRWHGNRRGWENDVRVRNTLLRLGWRIRPTTWTELNGRRTYLLAISRCCSGVITDVWRNEDENRPQISTAQAAERHASLSFTAPPVRRIAPE